MKALTIKEPWASLIIEGYKKKQSGIIEKLLFYKRYNYPKFN